MNRPLYHRCRFIHYGGLGYGRSSSVLSGVRILFVAGKRVATNSSALYLRITLFSPMQAGKVHFGYIYGFGAFGCLGLYSILNLMSEPQYTLDIVRVFSVLGYGLLPIVSLAAIAVFLDLRGLVGGVAGLLSILWCTYSATRFFVAALRMTPQRWLIAYPTLLFYACFALITIF